MEEFGVSTHSNLESPFPPFGGTGLLGCEWSNC